MSRRARAARPRFDPVRLDVFHHLFAAVCEEMGASLMRSSFSPNVRERRDLSCALFDGEGRMIGQAAHLPVHLGSTPMSVASAIERVAMGPGDAVLLNDPFAGGTHLPDLTLVSPIFLPGDERPSFYCANRAHHADVGGAAPGSMAPAHDVHGEGLRIPPVRLVRGGVIERELLELILSNMRVRREREGDLLAQWSANRVGEARLLAMAAEHGRAALLEHAAGLMEWTERLTRALVRGLPDGVRRFEDVLELEDGGEARIRLALTIRGDALDLDFTESDPAEGSGLNATRAVTVSAVTYVLRLLLPPGTPTNDGILRSVSVRTRPGSVVDAAYPAAVAAGNVETSQRLVEVLLGALAPLLPARIPAASAGTMSNLTLGGRDPRDGRDFAYYETIPGGAGAGPQGPGASAVQTHMTNTRNTPIEELELAHPVRVMALGVRHGSGGAGRARGGDGVVRRLRFLAPLYVSRVADRERHAPWGLGGGAAGAPGRARLRASADAGWKRIPAKGALAVEAGAELELETPGGGGFGAPEHA